MNQYNGRNGNGYQPLPSTSGKTPQPPIGNAHKCPIVDGLRYEGGPLMDAAANEIERLRNDLRTANDQYSSMTHERDQLANAMREILNMNAGEGGDSYAMQDFVRETLSDA